ncbi:MAG: hypothetical protein IPG85_11975 [Bacteroidetes bacterium]|nr:hypothetical protein [Bacteroidota bacterium]
MDTNNLTTGFFTRSAVTYANLWKLPSSNIVNASESVSFAIDQQTYLGQRLIKWTATAHYENGMSCLFLLLFFAKKRRIF